MKALTLLLYFPLLFITCTNGNKNPNNDKLFTMSNINKNPQDQDSPVAADMQVGTVSILPIFDGVGRVVAEETIRRQGVRNSWAEHQDLLLPGGILEYPMGGFLVLDGDRRILVDAGNGHVKSSDEDTGEFLQSLLDRGYSPADITDVFFTHLHSDHTGWAVQNGKPVFPNATHYVHEADWNYFGGPYSNLAPITAQLKLFNTDIRLSPSITTRHTPGHTPGSTVFVVTSGGEQALIIGDVAHTPAQFSNPDWYTVWDSDRAEAAKVRNAIADEAATTGDLIIPAHFPKMNGGHIKNEPRRFILLKQKE